MVRGAQENEPVRIVIAALGAKLDVVQIQENSLATTRNDAPSSIAPHDETAHGRWHVLPSAARSDAHVGDGLVVTSVDDANGLAPQAPRRIARRRAFAWIQVARWLRSLIDSTEVLRVAPRHFDDLRPHLDELAAPLLPTAAAPLAEADRDLVTGSSRLGRTPQCLTREQEQSRVVIDR
jgi:hypothetical protein